jgi:tetratricopeptide (TPR) repeat protein
MRHALLLLAVSCAARAAEADQRFEDALRLLRQGEVTKAREEFRAAWKGFETTRGESDSRAIEARIFYGQLLANTDQPDAALTVLGPITSGTGRIALCARGAFAVAARQKGQLSRSLKLFREVLRLFPREGPEDFAHISRLQGELATTLDLMKKFKEAEEAAFEAVRVIGQAGGRFQDHRSSALIVLANAQILAGHDGGAALSLAAARAALPPEARREAAILDGSLGMLALRAGRLDEAERYTRASLAALSQLLEPEHSEVSAVTFQLSMVLRRQKRNGEANEALARSRALVSRRPAAVSVWTWQEPPK